MIREKKKRIYGIINQPASQSVGRTGCPEKGSCHVVLMMFPPEKLPINKTGIANSNFDHTLHLRHVKCVQIYGRVE